MSAKKTRRGWQLLRYIDLERWCGVGILVWVPKTRCIYSAYLDTNGVVRVWVPHALLSPPVITGATRWRKMPVPPLLALSSPEEKQG